MNAVKGLSVNISLLTFTIIATSLVDSLGKELI